MLPIEHRPVRTRQKIIATAGYLKINFNKFWNKGIHYYLCNICFVLLLHEYVIHEVTHNWWDFNEDLKLFNDDLKLFNDDLKLFNDDLKLFNDDLKPFNDDLKPFNADLKLFNYNDLRVESWNYADCWCLEDTLNDLIKKRQVYGCKLQEFYESSEKTN